MADKDEKNLVQYRAKDGQVIKLTPEIIKRFLVAGNPQLVTDQELYFYMGVCKSRGLNPFIKDCHMIKFTNDPAAIITSIDFYRKRARAKSDCVGWKSGVILLDKNSALQYREGCIVLDGEELVGGWFEAKPKGWDTPMRKEVSLKRYIKRTRDGKITRFWSEENQPEMIAKVAESQGLRAIWPDEFQGLYVDAERESMDAQAELNQEIIKPESTKTIIPDFTAEDFDKQFEATRKGNAKIFDDFCQAAFKAGNYKSLDEMKTDVMASGLAEAFESDFEKYLKQNQKPAKKAQAASKASGKGSGKDAGKNAEPDASGADVDEFNQLVESDTWQELSALKSQFPDFYKKATGGKDPRTFKDAEAVIDEINTFMASGN